MTRRAGLTRRSHRRDASIRDPDAPPLKSQSRALLNQSRSVFQFTLDWVTSDKRLGPEHSGASCGAAWRQDLQSFTDPPRLLKETRLKRDIPVDANQMMNQGTSSAETPAYDLDVFNSQKIGLHYACV
jgi:hypothetical protein